MGTARVLLVEDSEVWQAILQMHISEALAGSAPAQVVGTFQDGARALRQEEWDLIVTDIGLPPDAGHVLGMQLVNLAKEAAVPCIVVSGTEAVTKQLVRDLLVGEDYRARDFFSKEELRSSPAIQRRFQSLIRAITAEEGKAGPVPSEGQEQGPAATLRLSPEPAGGANTASGQEQAATPQPRKVFIGILNACLYLGSEGLENLPIPKGPAEQAFLFFAQNVAAGLPAKVVNNSVLNKAVGAKGEDSADPFLRKTISQLNDRLRRWGPLREDRRWIIKGKGEHGYCLNTTDVQWEILKELKDSLRDAGSIYYLLIDPHKLQGNTPSKGQRLPAQSARPKRAVEDDENED
jgi:CheY-like chemotaxis protein